jgi:hypothetical protein
MKKELADLKLKNMILEDLLKKTGAVEFLIY